MSLSKIVAFNIHPFFYATIALVLGVGMGFFCEPFFNFQSNNNFERLFFTGLKLQGACLAVILVVTIFSLSYFLSNYFFSAGIAKLREKLPLSALLFLSCFVLGFVRYSQQARDHACLFTSAASQATSFRGVVTESNKIEHPRMKQNILVSISSFEKNGAWEPIQFLLQIYTPQAYPVMTGDLIQIDGVHIKKTPNSSFNRYLAKEGIGATIFAHDLAYQTISRPSFSFARCISDTKRAIFDRLQKKMSRENFTLFSSLFLGSRSFNKSYIRQIADQFQQWGISHYLARSGLHLTIFTLVWHTLFRFIPISLYIKQFLLILLTIIYLLFSWSSISFLRALYSFLIYGFCTLFIIRTHFLSILTLVTFIVLFINPMQLFFLDFQLSFILTFALAWISHIY